MTIKLPEPAAEVAMIYTGSQYNQKELRIVMFPSLPEKTKLYTSDQVKDLLEQIALEQETWIGYFIEDSIKEIRAIKDTIK